MFALQFTEYGPPEVLTVGEAAEPHAGPGEIRIAVKAASVNPADRTIRSGVMKEVFPVEFPYLSGLDASGVVDEVGEGVEDVEIGDAVFGLTRGGAAAEFAVLEAWAAKPGALSWEQAAGVGAVVETATRVFDMLGVTAGKTLLIEGAAGGVGSAAVQLAVALGATVLGTASEANHEFLAVLGAVPTTYGPGLVERVAALAPQGVDLVLDAAGSGSLPDLIKIAGNAHDVVTIADFTAAERGARMTHTADSSGYTKRGFAGLAVAATLAEEGRFTVPVHAVFPLEKAADAHELSATGHVRGKIVLTVRP
ncbi:NADP-dependent oxidoreductase [Amycolatopsis sp.]|jgi:NADPH:quinone reductase-like Zn-dependent oxidoreductase|uniref:NADP-dependent oxidoreductase n=1 Tax=Amycolatopsis sp. TaxID=37632 RepID=UPI002E05A96B|nr:NADP-dependent oxidoreductase [Amycolatopsis sp.]